jgi:hypothetical protein
MAAKTTKKAAKKFWQIGEKYFIRSVTYHYVGRLVSIDDKELVLEAASWVADSGRWNEALMLTKPLSEVEQYPDPVLVARTAIVDATKWRGGLPVETH